MINDNDSKKIVEILNNGLINIDDHLISITEAIEAKDTSSKEIFYIAETLESIRFNTDLIAKELTRIADQLARNV